LEYFVYILITGVSATSMTDMWSTIRAPLLRVRPPDYGLVGRWIGHMVGGRFRHDAIKNASPVHGEAVIGWTAHYLIGVAYSAVLLGVWGKEWIQQPTLAPALIVGIGTVVAPFFLMQPGMGAGIAASRTPNPNAARFHSLVMHTVFGLGLYASGWAVYFLFLN
jgi:hypothetical protein